MLTEKNNNIIANNLRSRKSNKNNIELDNYNNLMNNNLSNSNFEKYYAKKSSQSKIFNSSYSNILYNRNDRYVSDFNSNNSFKIYNQGKSSNEVKEDDNSPEVSHFFT